MEAKHLSLLIFDLDGARFGVDAGKVLESVWLPELTPIAESPPWVVGMFNLRGHIVPVTDLNLRFGQPTRPLSLSDQVVVLKNDEQSMGLIVSEVIDVIQLLSSAIEPAPHFEQASHGLEHLATGIASIADELVTLIDVSKLTKHAETFAMDETLETKTPSKQLYADSATEIRARFHARAMALRQRIIVEQAEAFLGLAVIEISGEYFGIELTAVQEFCDISQLSPIPCCPPHILGVMSLRGKLLTLIDPCRALNLAPSALCRKAVIALTSTALGTGFSDQLIGVAVDDVHDVVYLRREALHDPPSALREQCGAEITATTPYADKTMTMLDLPALLARSEWVVDENV